MPKIELSQEYIDKMIEEASEDIDTKDINKQISELLIDIALEEKDAILCMKDDFREDLMNVLQRIVSSVRRHSNPGIFPGSKEYGAYMKQVASEQNRVLCDIYNIIKPLTD